MRRDSVKSRNSSPSRTGTFETRNFRRGFALYEVLLGVAIFAFGVLALGRAVENCLNASALNAEEDRVRLILSNRMAEVQTMPGFPEKKEFRVDTGYGAVKVIQTSTRAGLTDEASGAEIAEIHRVTLTAKWTRSGIEQSQQISFYVYRPG